MNSEEKDKNVKLALKCREAYERIEFLEKLLVSAVIGGLFSFAFANATEVDSFTLKEVISCMVNAIAETCAVAIVTAIAYIPVKMFYSPKCKNEIRYQIYLILIGLGAMLVAVGLVYEMEKHGAHRYG